MRLTSAQPGRLHDFLGEAYVARPLDDFVAQAVRDLPAVVPSDLTVYGELNPRQRRFRWIWDPLDATFAGAEQTFRAVAHDHPFFSKYRGGGDGSAVKVSDHLTDTHLGHKAFYNEVWRRLGIRREIVVWLPAPRPVEITFALHRGRRDFSEAERLLLNLLRPHLIQAYRNAEVFTNLDRDRGLLAAGYEALRTGVLILAHNGRVQHATARAVELIERHFGAWRGRLPESLRSWVRTCAGGARTDAPKGRNPLVLDRNGARVVAHYLRAPDRTLLLLEEFRRESAPSETTATLGLTSREAEVLFWIAEGKTNEAIGTILRISSRTIEKHVEAILEKLGVENRTAAAARLREMQANLDSGMTVI